MHNVAICESTVGECLFDVVNMPILLFVNICNYGDVLMRGG